MSAGVQISQGRRNLLVGAFVVAASMMIVFGYVQYLAEEAHILDERSKELTSIGILKAEQIAEWRKERLSDAIRFAQGPTLTRGLEKSNTDDIRTMLTLNRKGNFYEDALLVSPSGEIKFSSQDTPELLTEATRRAIEVAFATHKPALSDFYRNTNGSVHIDVAAPVYSSENLPVAAFILRCAAADFLYPMIQSWPTTSMSAETLLVRKDGSDVVFLNKLRHEGHSAMTLRIPLTKTDLPAVQAILGKQGIVQGKDYRSISVLADVRPIPDSDWFLVTKIDLNEIIDHLRYLALIIMGFVSLGILLAATATAFGLRNRQATLYKNLYSAEQEHRIANERFRTILYSIGDAVITTNDEGRVQQMNPVAERMTGWTETEAAGHALEDVFRIINEETREPVKTPVWRVLREGKIVGLANHTVLLARNGKEYPIVDSGAPIRTEAGETVGVVLVFRDQTIERVAQEALLASQRRLSTLMDNLPGLVYRCHLDTYWTMEFISQGCRDLTGYNVDDLIDNKTVSFFDLIHPDDRQRVWDTVDGAVRQRQTYTLEYRIVTADGTTKWVWERGCGVFADNGTVEALEGFIHDITEHREAAEEQARLAEQLHQAQKIEVVGRLAGGVAHDFNNMLSVIIGNAELASDHIAGNAQLSGFISEILKAGNHSADLVRQLLGFASKQNITPRRLDLNETIKGLCPMIKRVLGETVAFEWQPGESLWPVNMDPNQLEQILVSLAFHSRNATSGAGAITLRTSNISQYKVNGETTSASVYGDYVQIAFSDNGTGLDPATQAQIFEPFFSPRQNSFGDGLGLALVYGIVKQNNGFIRVVNQPGKSTSFHIYLPRYNFARGAETAAPEEQTAAATAQPPPEADATKAPTATILLVEDESSVLWLTKVMLEKLGYSVIAVGGPTEALLQSRAFKGTIHLMLSDVVMPVMSGLDLCRTLGSERPDMKCLFMSAYTADIISQHGALDTNIHFIQKPFLRNELAAKVREALSS